MRIVDVNAFYTPSGGGVRTYVERKLKALPALGHEIVILSPGAENRTAAVGDHASVVTIAAPRFPLDKRYGYFNDEAALHRAIDALAPDYLEASSPWGSAAMVARWPGDARRALILHADPLSAYAYRWFGSLAPRPVIDRGFDRYWRHLRRMDQAFDHVISASRDLSDRMTAGGLSRVRTVPMGVEPGIFDPGLRDEALRASLLADCALGSDATLLLTIGRFAPEKRIPLVINAALAAGSRSPIGLIVVGEGRDQAAVRRACAHSPHVRILEPVRSRDRLARLMASCDALVHGCEAETFCMVAAEARASGLPLIVPDRGGASDHHRPGQGMCYRATEGSALVEAIGAFVDADPWRQRRNAIRAAGDVQSMNMHFEALMALYGQQRVMRHAA